MNQNSLPLEQLIDEAYHRVEHLNYHPNTLKSYQRIWRRLLDWSKKHGFCSMSEDLAAQFLKEYGIPFGGEPDEPLDSSKRQIRACVRVLEEFALHGCWQRRGSTNKIVIPPALEAGVTGFLEYSKVQHGLFPSTLSVRNYHLRLFTSFLETRQIQNWAELSPAILSAFFALYVYMKPSTLAHLAWNIRQFLKYLWLNELHPQDISSCLPKFKVRTDNLIPSVWTREHVEALLSAVDRGSPLGKRDYAMLLLVIRLGLRAGEIRTLKLDHIHWEKAELELFQPKTQNTVRLPLSDEVGKAIIDYLQNGRPNVAYREVFIRHKAPFEPFAYNTRFYQLVSNYRQKANIPPDCSNRRGLHSLRHTLASCLLEQGTPLQTIAAILGHASVETTRIYTKVDVEALRSAALDLEEVCHE